jgi:hypothetical protein
LTTLLRKLLPKKNPVWDGTMRATAAAILFFVILSEAKNPSFRLWPLKMKDMKIDSSLRFAPFRMTESKAKRRIHLSAFGLWR